MTARARPLLVVAGLFLLLFCATACWSLATPPFAAPDEPVQVLKAVAVAHGEFVGSPDGGPADPDTDVVVPSAYVTGLHAASCFLRDLGVTPACEPALPDEAAPIAVTIYVGRYPPLYYLLVGWPSLWLHSQAGLVVLRLLSAALSAALLTAGFASVVFYSRSRLALAGLAVAATPEVFFLGGVVNPSGFEISAALALWAAGLVLVLEHAHAPPMPLVAVAATAASLEELARGLSPLYVAVTGVLLALVARPRAVRALAAARRVRVGAAAVVLAGGLALAWTLTVHALDVQKSPYVAPGPGGYFRELVSDQLLYLKETVGFFGIINVPAPHAAYLLVAAAAGVVVLTGLAISGVGGALSLVASSALLLAVPFAVVLSQTRALSGIIWQGRDGAPLVLGIPVLAAALAGRRAGWHRFAAGACCVAAAAAGTAAVIAFAGTLNRYAAGASAHFSFYGNAGWQAPLGDLRLFALFAGAQALGLVWLVAAVLPPPEARRGAAQGVRRLRA